MTRHILHALLSIFLLSCHSSDGGTQLVALQQADSFMQFHPNNALLSLEKMEEPDALSKSEKAYFALLLTQAKDKTNVLHTTDSLMRMAVDYYDSANDDVVLTMKAHYYLARIYQDIDSVSPSVREFLTALHLAEEIQDSEFTYLSLAKLGLLLENHKLLDEADSLYQRAEDIAILNKDSLLLALTLADRADICILKGKYTEAETRLLKALAIAKIKDQNRTERAITNSLAFLYEEMGKHNDALQHGQSYMRLQSDSTKLFECYLIIGDGYYNLHQNDSASYYLAKSMSSANLYTKKKASRILSELAKQEGSLIKSLQWKDSCIAYTDSISSISKSVEAMKSIKDVINAQLTTRYLSFAHYHWLALLSIILILLALLLFFVYKRRKYRIMLALSESKTSSMKEKIEYKTKEIIRLKELISECENDRAKVLVLSRKLNTASAKKEKLFDKLIDTLPLFKDLTQLIEENRKSGISKDLITAKQWDKIVADIDSIADKFSVRLLENYSMLKTDDIHFCCLLKIGFKYSDIACLCGRTSNMMYKRRNLVIERIGLNLDSLEAFIREF